MEVNEIHENDSRRRLYKLWCLLLLFGITYCIHAVLQKLVAIRAPDYPYTIALLSPISGLFVYSFIWLVWYRDVPCCGSQVPTWKLILVAGLFSLHNILFSVGNAGDTIPGSIVVILSKLVVAYSAFFSYFPPIKRSLTVIQAWALVLLLVGGCIVLVPTWETNNETSLSSASVPIFRPEYLLKLTCLLVAPAVLSMAMLVVEVALQGGHVEIVPIWTRICAFEAVISIAMAPVSAKLMDMSLSDVPGNFLAGLECLLLGRDNLSTNGNSSQCAFVPILFVCNILSGCTYNLAMAASVRLGGATLMWFVRAATLPASSLLFAVPFIMGREHVETVTIWELVGLCCATFALVMFNNKYEYLISCIRHVRMRVSSLRHGYESLLEIPASTAIAADFESLPI